MRCSPNWWHWEQNDSLIITNLFPRPPHRCIMTIRNCLSFSLYRSVRADYKFQNDGYCLNVAVSGIRGCIVPCFPAVQMINYTICLLACSTHISHCRGYVKTCQWLWNALFPQPPSQDYPSGLAWVSQWSQGSHIYQFSPFDSMTTPNI